MLAYFNCKHSQAEICIPHRVHWNNFLSQVSFFRRDNLTFSALFVEAESKQMITGLPLPRRSKIASMLLLLFSQGTFPTLLIESQTEDKITYCVQKGKTAGDRSRLISKGKVGFCYFSEFQMFHFKLVVDVTIRTEGTIETKLAHHCRCNYEPNLKYKWTPIWVNSFYF
jgi:hypothetical protein